MPSLPFATRIQSVLADRKVHDALRRAQREARELERQSILTRIAEGAKVCHAASHEQAQQNHNDEEDDEDDDEFFAQFRAKRLQGSSTLLDVKQCINSIAFNSNLCMTVEMKSLAEFPIFGSVRDVSSADFVEQVEHFAVFAQNQWEQKLSA